MAPRHTSEAKDPVIGFVLGLCFPGLGYLYAARVGSFVITLVMVGAILFYSNLWFALIYHVISAISGAGAVKRWNAARAPDDALPVPPPPAPGAHRPTDPAPREAQPAGPAPPRPARRPPLDADEFLAELRRGWRGQSTGELSGPEFAALKANAIERLRVPDHEEAEALLEASHELVGAGVLTPRERGRIQSRVGRP